MKVSKPELLQAIRDGGQVSELAKRFGITPRGLRKRIQENGDLRDALNESREQLVDLAQSKLGDAVREGAAWAVKFTLETWGRDRGFTRTVQVESDAPAGVMHLYFPDDGRDKPDPSNPEPIQTGTEASNAK